MFRAVSPLAKTQPLSDRVNSHRSESSMGLFCQFFFFFVQLFLACVEKHSGSFSLLFSSVLPLLVRFGEVVFQAQDKASRPGQARPGQPASPAPLKRSPSTTPRHHCKEKCLKIPGVILRSTGVPGTLRPGYGGRRWSPFRRILTAPARPPAAAETRHT